MLALTSPISELSDQADIAIRRGRWVQIRVWRGNKHGERLRIRKTTEIWIAKTAVSESLIHIQSGRMYDSG